jgi:uncharacterized protein (DUF2141 family)
MFNCCNIVSRWQRLTARSDRPTRRPYGWPAATILAAGGLLTMVALATAASAQSPAPLGDTGVRIVVRVHGVRSSSGEVVAVLYGDNPDDFLRAGKRVARVRTPAAMGVVVLELSAPRSGRYAIAIYHDENGNRKLDRALTGLPTEGFGFSNNPRIWLRPPRLEEAAFTVDARPIAVDIDLRY